jgi:hypothetical protein
MKENINNLSRLTALKETLAEKNVSANAISNIEKALKKGMVFRNADDLSILSLPATDVNILETAVFFCSPPSATVRTFEFTFRPTENAEYFFGYQFVVT